MNFEPQKFFIGLIDFFSILLPGALLTYMLQGYLGPLFLGHDYGQLTGTKAWVAFFISSYLLGHFVFLLGARLLDDYFYDPIRGATADKQIERLAKGKKLPWPITRWLAKFLINTRHDKALKRVLRIKNHYLGQLSAAQAINAFQWSKAKLTLENPGAMSTIQRFEADSKFFRSLLIVLVALFIWGFVGSRWTLVLVSMPLMVLAFWRYVDQRMKSTIQAYWYIIILESQLENGFRESSKPRKDGMTHAGGVVYRGKGDSVEYLLVQASKKPKEWVLPKGHIEVDESLKETAVREVIEEAGVVARVECKLPKISLLINDESIKIQFYLMEAVEIRVPGEKRKHQWKPLEEAIEQAKHPESKEQLRVAEKKRLKISQAS